MIKSKQSIVLFKMKNGLFYMQEVKEEESNK